MKFSTKMLYGIASVGEAGLYNIMGTFALFFLTTVVGVDPAAAGTITAIGSIWETVCGAVIGYASDNTDTRFGKRKPYILIASIPLMVFTSLFFTSVHVDGGLQAVYYGFMMVMFWSAFSLFYVPYLAWGAELTQDYDERTVLRGFAYFFSTIGMAMGLVLPNIAVEYLMEQGHSLEGSWMINGIFIGVICGLAIFIGAAGIRDHYELAYAAEHGGAKKGAKRQSASVAPPEGKEARSLFQPAADMIKNYLQILRLRTVRYIIGASVCYLISYAIFCSVRMYYFTFNMKLSAGAITLVMLLLTFASIAFVPLIWGLSKRLDKRTSFVMGMVVCAAAMGIYGFIGVSSVLDICIFSVFYSIATITYWQLMPSMIYDVCEVDELVNDKRRGGLVISLQSLSESLANAVGLQLLGLILSFSGFDGEAAVQTETALQWINLSFSVIPAVLMLISAFCIIRYPVSKTMYLQVVQALKDRAEGKEVNMEPFRRLK